MAGLEDIVGKTGNYTVRDKFKRFDNRFIRPYLIRDLKVSNKRVWVVGVFKLCGNFKNKQYLSLSLTLFNLCTGCGAKDYRDVLEVDDAGRHRGDAKEPIDAGPNIGNGINERTLPE